MHMEGHALCQPDPQGEHGLEVPGTSHRHHVRQGEALVEHDRGLAALAVGLRTLDLDADHCAPGDGTRRPEKSPISAGTNATVD